MKKLATCASVDQLARLSLSLSPAAVDLSLSLSRSASITGARTATCWSSSQSLVTCAVSLLRSSYFQLTASCACNPH